MSTFNDHPKWNHQEFVGFLLVYAAYSDMEFSEDERTMIRQNVNDNQLKELEDAYLAMSDIDRIKTIESYRGRFFSSDAEKEKLFSMLNTFFKIDGQYSIMERNLMRMLHKIL